MEAKVTIRNVWQHTQDRQCAYCGKTIRFSGIRFEHNVTNVTYDQYDLDYCANHRLYTVKKHFKNVINFKGLTAINWISTDKLYQ